MLRKYLNKTNTIYNRLGFSIEFFEKNENLVFSNLGVMDKTQYFKYNDFPENLEEKQKFLNKVGEKINFVFYQGSFEKNSNIYWIISLDRETFFSEIYFELDRPSPISVRMS